MFNNANKNAVLSFVLDLLIKESDYEAETLSKQRLQEVTFASIKAENEVLKLQKLFGTDGENATEEEYKRFEEATVEADKLSQAEYDMGELLKTVKLLREQIEYLTEYEERA